jgi:hypothetical protein
LIVTGFTTRSNGSHYADVDLAPFYALRYDMKVKSKQISLVILLIGDAFTLALVTVIGFASHNTLESAGSRIFTTYLPLLGAWFLVAPYLQAFNINRASNASQLWRPIWAIVLAAPLAAWLRGLWLSSPISPIFVAVIAGTSAAAILIWRVLFYLLLSKLGRSDG